MPLSKADSKAYRPLTLQPAVLIFNILIVLACTALLGLAIISANASGSETSNQVSTTSPYNNTTEPPAPTAPNPGLQLLLGTDFTPAKYFIYIFLPKIIVVVLQSCWLTSCAQTWAMESVYALSSRSGATAEQLFTKSLKTSGTSLVIRLVTLVRIGITAILALIPEVFAVIPTDTCTTDAGPAQPCEPIVQVNSLLAGIAMAILALIVVLIVVITIQNQARHALCHVHEDATTISFVTRMLAGGDQSLVDTLKVLNPEAIGSQICQALQGLVFRLGRLQHPDGQQTFGIYARRSSTAGQSRSKSPRYSSIHNPGSISTQPRGQASWGSRSRIENLLAIFCLAPTCVLFVLILTYRAIGQSTSSFNNFMNSKFGPRFLLSGLALLISVLVNLIDSRNRDTEIWYAMMERPQPAECSVQCGVSASPWTSILSSQGRHQSWKSRLLSTAAISTDALLIVVSGVPFAPAQTSTSYEACTFISLAILLFMGSTLSITAVTSRRLPILPRTPNTMGNRMSYIWGGNMVNDNSPGSGAQHDAKTQCTASDCHRYVFEHTKSSSNQNRWCVNLVNDPYRESLGSAFGNSVDVEMVQLFPKIEQQAGKASNVEEVSTNM